MSDRGLRAKDENEDAVAAEWASSTASRGGGARRLRRCLELGKRAHRRDRRRHDRPRRTRPVREVGRAARAPKGAVVSAIHAAHRAVARLAESMADFGETSATIVVAFVHKRTLTVAWLGDSAAIGTASATPSS
ncbi:MAG: hypothetical protein U0169_26435 [Polyangiaceae bacterium]